MYVTIFILFIQILKSYKAASPTAVFKEKKIHIQSLFYSRIKNTLKKIKVIKNMVVNLPRHVKCYNKMVFK